MAGVQDDHLLSRSRVGQELVHVAQPHAGLGAHVGIGVTGPQIRDAVLFQAMASDADAQGVAFLRSVAGLG
jgi:hypothetical protein